MPKNDMEVFEKLTSAPDTPLPIDFLTYAVFAHEKREWIKHFESTQGKAPVQSDIDYWISQLTDSQFQSMRTEAQDFFSDAAESLYESRLKVAKDKILKSAIVSEVKSAGAFWKQVILALITAILAPLILGAGIGAALFADKILPTVGAVAHSISSGPTTPNPTPPSTTKQ